jgi:hypothetical protein
LIWRSACRAHGARTHRLKLHSVAGHATKVDQSGARHTPRLVRAAVALDAAVSSCFTRSAICLDCRSHARRASRVLR